uniref:MATH domain-containing protein n=1 Tax=Romanomermis culicivorax TaxID=13658 RepID=A0A915KRE0_ROMCU
MGFHLRNRSRRTKVPGINSWYIQWKEATSQILVSRFTLTGLGWRLEFKTGKHSAYILGSLAKRHFIILRHASFFANLLLAPCPRQEMQLGLSEFDNNELVGNSGVITSQFSDGDFLNSAKRQNKRRRNRNKNNRRIYWDNDSTLPSDFFWPIIRLKALLVTEMMMNLKKKRQSTNLFYVVQNKLNFIVWISMRKFSSKGTKCSAKIFQENASEVFLIDPPPRKFIPCMMDFREILDHKKKKIPGYERQLQFCSTEVQKIRFWGMCKIRNLQITERILPPTDESCQQQWCSVEIIMFQLELTQINRTVIRTKLNSAKSFRN